MAAMRWGVVIPMALCLCAAEAQAVKPNPGMKSQANAAAAARKKGVKLVDLNAADRKALAALPGLTPALADKIIQGRPYRSKFELITRGILPKELFASLRYRIEARQTAKLP